MYEHELHLAPRAARPLSVRARIGSTGETVPPHAFFVFSAVLHYLGPSFAVLLFARVDVLGVAWLRIVAAAVVFAVWRRPWRAVAPLDRSGRRLLAGHGGLHPSARPAAVGVGVSSSVIPYVTDQLAMTRLSRPTYSLMISLLPATATVIGIIVLAQLPSASSYSASAS
jgi:threonine/homoserine efflux transporter RhtA